MNQCRVIAAVVAVLVPAVTAAQDPTLAYPTKTVRLIVAQGAGGAVDVHSRFLASKLSERLGRQFIVDNRPGRSIAWEIAARAAPDGYTLIAVVPDFTFAPALYPTLSVDPLKDFAPVALTSRAPYLLTAHPGVAAKSVQELIALAKSQPGKLNFGGGLPGSGTNLVAIWFMSMAGIKATYVPYKGGVAQATTDLLAGQIQAGFSTGSAVAHVKSGRLRALGVSTARRSTVLPDIPTIAEQGLTRFDASTFHGIATTAGTPASVINKLSAELARIANLPETVDRLRADNSEPVESTPAQFRQFIANEVPRWRKLVKDSRITVD